MERFTNLNFGALVYHIDAKLSRRNLSSANFFINFYIVSYSEKVSI